MKCKSCDLVISSNKRTDAMFCDDLCKNDYYNNKKRVQALYHKAFKSVEEMIALSNKFDYLKEDVDILVDYIGELTTTIYS